MTVKKTTPKRPQRKLTISMDAELYKEVQYKCKNNLCISMSALIKVFLKSFVSQSGVGFYVGDPQIGRIFQHWINKQQLERARKGCKVLPYPKLKNLYKT